MRIAVVGAGLVGVCSAWALAGEGHEVTVFDLHDSVAAGASFAPAGVLAAGWFSPTVWPGLPTPSLAGVLDGESAFHLGSGTDLAALGWLRRWRGASRGALLAASRTTLTRLLAYGRECLDGLQREHPLDYERSSGALLLLPEERDLAAAGPWLRLLAEAPVRHALLDAAQCRVLEPGLDAQAALHAGVHLPEAAGGNSRQLAHLLRGEAQRRGVEFRFGVRVRSIGAGPSPRLEHEASAPPEPGARVERQQEQFDQVVVCAALGSAELLRPHGLKLPLLPVWGASVTAPLRHLDAHPDAGPRSIVIDARSGASIGRLGQRLRASAGGLLSGPGRTPDEEDEAGFEERIYHALDTWFPGAIETSKAQRWTGARPSLPEGLPLIGPGPAAGLWLNLGHGGFGWALCAASARLLADAMAGRTTAVPLDLLSIGRYR